MPPHSEVWVKTKVNSKHDHTEGIEGITNTGGECKRHKILLMKALVRVENSMVYTRLLNTASSPRKLEEGETVCYLSDLQSPYKINVSKSQDTCTNWSHTNGQIEIPVRTQCFTPEVDYSESNISEKQKAEMNEILTINCEAFVGPDGSLGLTNLYEHEIEVVPGAKPIQKLPYRMAPEARERLERCVQDQLRQGIIEETNTGPWASPVFLVKKADGGDRLVCDYRGLNKQTIDQFLNVPRVEDTIDAVGAVKPKYITVMDLQQAFHQLPIRNQDRDKTAFITATGKYRYKVVSMGLKNAARSCQMVLDMIMRGIRFKSCLIYIDDVVLYARDWDQHLKDVEDVLQRLIRAGLKLKPSKTKVACQETLFLGHLIGEYGIKPNPDKVRTIHSMPPPKDLTGLRRFLGITGYYRRFIPDYGKIACPLNCLMKDDTEWEWSEACQNAFESLKMALTSDSLLMYPDFAKKFLVTTDASGTGVGAELSQINDDGIERPVAFLSKKFQKSQKNYSTLDKELLGICVAVAYWDVYLKGRKFLIRTDHSALKYILGYSAKFNLRQSKWRAFLNQYDFEIEHIKGKSNVVADALSRLEHNSEDQSIAPGVEEFIEKHLELNQVCSLADNGKGQDQEQVGAVAHMSDKKTPNNRKRNRYASGLNGKFQIVFDGLGLSEECVRNAQLEDEECSDLINFITDRQLSEDPDRARKVLITEENFMLNDGILHNIHTTLGPKAESYARLVIPLRLRKIILEVHHDSPLGAHLNPQKMISVMREIFLAFHVPGC